jgi:hypothetical protein
MSATLKPPFFLDEDQAWIDEWLAHVIRCTEEASLEQQGHLNFTAVFENGKLIGPKRTKDGKMFGTLFTWKGHEVLSSNDIKTIFWRPEDSEHLQQWLMRCESGLKECEGKEVHQVLINVWIPLHHPTPILRGKIDAGNHVPFEKFTHEIVFEFCTQKREEEEAEFWSTPTPEERERMMRELNARRQGSLFHSCAGKPPTPK